MGRTRLLRFKCIKWKWGKREPGPVRGGVLCGGRGAAWLKKAERRLRARLRGNANGGGTAATVPTTGMARRVGWGKAWRVVGRAVWDGSLLLLPGRGGKNNP